MEWQYGTAPWTRKLQPGEHLNLPIQIGSASDGWQTVTTPTDDKPSAASGGEKLSSRQVSKLPLNKRDFSQLLLLAAGTMTDTNGSANFTQQFAVNGQRGANAVFAMDGVDIDRSGSWAAPPLPTSTWTRCRKSSHFPA